MLRMSGVSASIVLTAQQHLLRAHNQLAQTSTRLATLRRINHASDDPAGLIAAEQLRSELESLQRESAAAERARALVRMADSGTAQAIDLLQQIRGNVVQAANGATSAEEQAALQLEIDAAMDALDHIGHTTSFAGRPLLDGEAVIELGSLDVAAITLPDVSSGSLGLAEVRLTALRSGGGASLAAGDADLSIEVLDGAENQLVSARAELGSFERYSIDSTQSVLVSTIQNISGAISQIADTDVALETANFARFSVLLQTAAASLPLANIDPNTVLELLEPRR